MYIYKEKLTEGLRVKNYKAMCELLSEPIKSGKSKVYQLDKWRRYFEFQREGNSFVIGAIYDQEKPKIDLRVNNGKNPNSHGNNKGKYKYYEPFANTMLYALKDKDELTWSRNAWMIHLGLVNKKYCESRARLEARDKFGSNRVDYFWLTVQSKTKSIFDTNLNRMCCDGMIKVEEQLLYSLSDKSQYVTATESQKEEYDAIRTEVLSELAEIKDVELANFHELFSKNIRKENKDKQLLESFKRMLRDKLKEKLNWNKVLVLIKVKRLMEPEKYVDESDKLNQLVVDEFIRMNNKSYEKKKQEYDHIREEKYNDCKYFLEMDLDVLWGTKSSSEVERKKKRYLSSQGLFEPSIEQYENEKKLINMFIDKDIVKKKNIKLISKGIKRIEGMVIKQRMA